MGKRIRIVIALAVFVGLLYAQSVVGRATSSSAALSATLTGAAERPTHGDPNGFGAASITLSARLRKVCYGITYIKIGTPTAAHIHRGTARQVGRIVVDLLGSHPRRRSACVSGVSRRTIDAISANPRGFYLDIHNRAYPRGAIRGQLHR